MLGLRAIEKLFGRYLPSPFTIAVLLTGLTIVLALVFGNSAPNTSKLAHVLILWEKGIWNNGLLVFAYQMMLILVLGHVLVLSPPMAQLILRLTGLVRNTAQAALLVAVSTMLVSFFNWGLGLIFGALFARKVGEYAQEKQIPLNYPLIGACGYSGLMVWHGGISGSAPIKVAENGHLQELMIAAGNSNLASVLPDTLSTSLTIFSWSNLVVFACVVLCSAILAFYLGKKATDTSTLTVLQRYSFAKEATKKLKGAEKIEYSKWPALFFGGVLFCTFLLQYFPAIRSLNITPNLLNFFMLALAILLHGSFRSFLNAVEESIGDISGILIQFPLYFGVMGIMGGSGMIAQISDLFVSFSTTTTLPLFTFFSAAVVNVFVPSGGGQWAVQGPLVLESALTLGVPLPKIVMALAYGDQLTNMLQPFWALPLLGITKLKAKEILPYTVLFMGVGMLIYVAALLLF
ncbi:MAG: TIGR00366 family protein [Bacteroidota bacterium]